MSFLLALTPLALTLASAPPQSANVTLGIDELLSRHIQLIEGKRIALITNPSGVDGQLVPTADRLARDERFELVQLFGPEHGIRGDVPAGDSVASEVDPVTGVPVESLYGKSRRPSQEALAKVDVVLFDIQDVGSRLYTYVSTLGEAMHAAAEAGKPIIVLDRPNPIGGTLFEGPVREEAWKSFIGWGPLPVTHGMTAGEIARFYRQELGIDCQLSVVRMGRWKREMAWEDTGLRWTQTSPHIPHSLSAHVYVATGMAAAVTENVNDGVGSTMPFEVLGAEFLDAQAFARAMSLHELPGVRFQAIAYRPFYGGFEGTPLRGVRLVVDDTHRFRPLRTALSFLVTLRERHPEALRFKSADVFAKHWGNERVLEQILAGDSVQDIEAGWSAERQAFASRRDAVLLYR